MQRISTCLWFDNNAEEAVNFYTSVFKDSRIVNTVYYGEGAPFPKGTVLTIVFELNGQEFIALNGGPHFSFNPAVSILVKCRDQKEIDYYWEKLSEGGAEEMCGWLKDKFGLSWQVAPANFDKLFQSTEPGKSDRAMAAMMKMKKLNIRELEEA